ncbi:MULTISPECIES: ribosomal protein S18-alanine N-acetyltransferase [Amycolatopsis]|uniref:Ribosomal protein S18-alanine N-acetyltransferase n=1 Tax=Amycolatopsis thermalba TaxID=944492 RepID=A0ABY4NR26_9PSEU|nr:MULTISPECIES: ribosomal protein S18-alanine N-acetyltransferase [Amycolatopsis]OXM73926.1 ribosomal-protein-alanine N-acetyltransferase [Amycolatopsis sp. KNN50.9b]UQS22429.1 ribosomal protein S18-alanine N-acetyltransferase [Amycolatopsis thermalba]
MKLAKLRRKDIPRCVEIEQVLFAGDDPWSARAFHSELDSGGYYLGAYTPEDVLIGYGGLAVVGSRGDYEASVHTIGVDPGYQGQGVGTALLRALLARADEVRAPVFLEVRTDNDRAQELYRRHGFEQIGLRKRYYHPSGADAYTMMRPAVTKQEVG